MMHSQLGRILLTDPLRTADEQAATPDERGSYGELLDLIDEIIGQIDGPTTASAKPPAAA